MFHLFAQKTTLAKKSRKIPNPLPSNRLRIIFLKDSRAHASTADTPGDRRAPPPARLELSRDSPVRVRISDTAAVRATRLLSVSPPTARIRATKHAAAS